MVSKSKIKSAENKNKPLYGTGKRIDMSAKAIIDNVVYSLTDKWAFYRLTNTSFDFLSTHGQISLAQGTTGAFKALISDRTEILECELIITYVPYDIDAWESQVYKRIKDWNPGSESFNTYMNEQYDHLFTHEFMNKIAYLGVNLGKRGALEKENFSVFEEGIRGAFDFVKDWASTALQVPSEEISSREEQETRKQEQEIYRVLQTGNLRAERVTTEELLLMLKRQFWPAMPAPGLDIDVENRVGSGDLELELAHVIENKYKFLKIKQYYGSQELTGYRAVLSFSKFPKYGQFPLSFVPYFYWPAKLGYNFTCYARFDLIPTMVMRKIIGKKKKEKADELNNMMEGGSSAIDSMVNPDTEAQDNLSDLNEIDRELTRSGAPWLRGSYRIVVESSDENNLKDTCSVLKQKYEQLGVTLNWTNGDQALLFLEQMPGDKKRMKSFEQTTNLEMIGGSGLNFSSEVGDPIMRGDI